MRSTKQYGLVNSWQEHRMLVHAEHTRQREEKSLHKKYRKDKKHAKDKRIQSTRCGCTST